MAYRWGRGKNPTGDRTLESYWGRHLQSQLDSMDKEEVNHLEEGNRLVLLNEYRTQQWAYEVVNFGIQRDRLYVRLVKTTKTGRVSKAKDAESLFWLDSLHWSTYHYFDGVEKEIDEYLENTKEYYVSGQSRDSQRQKVYDSERAVKRKYGDIKKFGSVFEANQFLQKIMDSEEFEQMFPDFDPYVKNALKIKICNRTKHKARATYGRNEITIAGNSRDWGLSTWVILHELAHFTSEGAQHNAPFTTHFADLVEMVDEDMARKLRNQFDYRNVDY